MKRNSPDVFALVVLAGAASGEFMFGLVGAVIGTLAAAFVACRVRFE
ncbi:MAG: hypothetical protein V3W37_02375 [Candidatus Binatia bacterium]